MQYTSLSSLALCALIACAPGCGNSEKKEVDPLASVQGTIPVKVGQKFQISLPADPTGGYGWSTQTLDTDYLQHVSGIYTEKNGHETWTFKALKKGSTTIALTYKQQWRTDVTPARTYTAQVEIV